MIKHEQYDFKYIGVDRIKAPSYRNMNFAMLQKLYNDLNERPDYDVEPIEVIEIKGGGAVPLYEITNGRHRHLASGLTGRKTVPCLIKKEGN